MRFKIEDPKIMSKDDKRKVDRWHVSVAQYHMDRINADVTPNEIVKIYTEAQKYMRRFSIAYDQWAAKTVQFYCEPHKIGFTTHAEFVAHIEAEHEAP